MIVSKETALLLKEKGYDVPCGAFMNDNIIKGGSIIKVDPPFDCNKSHDWMLSAPTLHEVAEWLWEVHKIHVDVVPDGFGNKDNLIWHAIVWVIYESLNPQPYIVRNELDEIIVFDTRNQAIEAAIVKALKNYL
jgi:hypothetical protein